MNAANSNPPPIERCVRFFETFTIHSMAQLRDIYAQDASFKDPFNEVRGVAAIEQIFRHMFETTHEPRFHITERFMSQDGVVLAWDFTFRFRRFSPGVTQTIRGLSVLRFNEQGLIAQHRDYWDAAEELYEKLPIVGNAMRWLRRRVMR